MPCDKEKRFPKGISQGILYLTDRTLVFKQKGKAEHPAPLLVVEDIKSVRKISILRTLLLLAGTRKSIEIVVSGRSKPVQFIGGGRRAQVGLPEVDGFSLLALAEGEPANQA
ncbi:unnamed protein product, partial [Mesorhabditis spiculigera]